MGEVVPHTPHLFCLPSNLDEVRRRIDQFGGTNVRVVDTGTRVTSVFFDYPRGEDPAASAKALRDFGVQLTEEGLILDRRPQSVKE